MNKKLVFFSIFVLTMIFVVFFVALQDSQNSQMSVMGEDSHRGSVLENTQTSPVLAGWKIINAPLPEFKNPILLINSNLNSNLNSASSSTSNTSTNTKSLSAIHFFTNNDLAKLKNLHGKCFLLNVWASWCVECAKEHSLLEKLNKTNVQIIGLNYKDDADQARFWLEQKSNPFAKIISEPENFIGLAFDLGVTGAPESFFIDQNLNIKLRKLGVLTKEDLVFLQNKFSHCNKIDAN